MKMKFQEVLLLCVFFATTMSVSRSANILAVLPLDIPSHHRFSQPILRDLANRGHKITVLTPIQDPKPPANYQQIIVPRMKMWDAVSPGVNSSMLTPKTNVFINSQMDLRNRTLLLTDFILRSAPLQNFLDREDLSYDLIICELFHIQPFLMLSHTFKAPIVALSAFGHGHFINQQMGNPYELSYISHENLILPTRYKFFDRLKNTFWTMIDLVERNMWLSEQNELAKKYIIRQQSEDDHELLPTLKDLEKNISLVLINSHFSIDTVRPNVPGVVDVGGVHITPPNKLSSDVDKFINGASSGLIYINLESDVMNSEISKTHVQMFKKLFNQNSKNKFIWQRDDLADNLSNVLVSPSLKQSDVLAYENVKVFITHGGQLNIQDAVARGVPVICIPMYGDQFSSCARAKEFGFAEELNVEDLCENSLGDAIKKILQRPCYKEAVLKVSSVFNDKPNPPLYTATYWIEYVIKHKGAKHMKSPALELSWYEYYVLDSVAVMGLTTYYIIWTLNWLFWNVMLRKKIVRDDIQHLVDMHKPKRE